VTDRRYWQDPRELEQKVARALEGGVNMVQLREKGLPGGELLQLGNRLRRVTRGRALLFVNDRVDVALACGADGVQLGEAGLSVEAARRAAGGRLLLGRSVHSVAGALAAQRGGAGFLLVGTVFPTGSHPTANVAGPRILSQVARQVAIPFVGIGGITAANVSQVVHAGAWGAAVISAIMGAEDPADAAHRLKEAMDAAWEARPAARPIAAGTEDTDGSPPGVPAGARRNGRP
jgi:thiamine-phosphate pyrophosphorylase